MELVKQIHEKEPISLLHAFWLNDASLTAVRISKKLRIPMLATAMGQEVRTPSRYLKILKEEHIPCVALCDFQSELLEAQGIEPKETIPWGVNGPVLEEKSFDLIFVGNLIPLKKPDYFLDLFQRLKVDRPDSKAVVVGNGPMNYSLRQQAGASGLESNVVFLGELSYKKTQSFIARSKILVHPASYEGFGMTIIEALAARTHVMAQKTGIAASLDAVNILSMNVEEDAQKILELLATDAAPSTRFDIADTVERYNTLYESITGKS